ncbi:MAG: translation initiation factor IF-2 [Candidatus Makaraimicrobium thalassicum]|nr:MAG: translation initiation factor IF-2 [Candidatus Omnitrophota bacterium]
MPIKVRNLAKELGVSSEDVLGQLCRLYVDVKDEDSGIDDKIAGLIRIKLGGSGVVKKPSKKGGKKAGALATSGSKTAKAAGKAKEKVKGEGAAGRQGKKAPAVEASCSTEPKKPRSRGAVEPEQKAKPALKGKAKKVEKTKKVEKAEPVVEKAEPVVGIVKKIAKPGPTANKARKTVKPGPAIEIVERGIKSGLRARPTGRKRKFGQEPRKAGVPEPAQVPLRKAGRKKIEMQVPANIRALAPRINMKPNAIIQYLMGKGMFANINQDLEEDTVRGVMEHFGYELELPRTAESMQRELLAESYREEAPEGGREAKTAVESRAPVVTFMGHVDHGKTSLLDYIRKTMVTKGEKGGITQHIGAYRVETAGGSVTFLDTPGHAAFTAMRARGANATDVVVLVVAAEDGVMPQTKEAIDHARAAGVPIVVAINKCDLPGADPDRVRTDLQKEDLTAEKWGGNTVMVEVSAVTGEGVDHLVEMLMLESEMLELKANPKLRARGVVIETRKTPGQGVVVTLLVQNGTLYTGDIVLCGPYYGKVKAMIDDVGTRVEKANPAMPVKVLGLQGVPEAGEEFFVVKDEKKARTLALLKQDESRNKHMAGSQRVSLEDFHSRMAEGDIKELKIILKADVQGSVEALKLSLEELATAEVKLKIIHSAVGNINESDAMLAVVSNAVVIGFHVKMDPKAEELAKSEKVDVHIYDVIYEAIADVRAGMEGLLEPEEREIFQGSAQIREIFPSRAGKVAGCAVVKGTIHRKDRVKVKRGQETIYEGEINSLKRFKDDVKEVREGFECGMSVKGFNNIRKNDIIEAFTIEKIARRL